MPLEGDHRVDDVPSSANGMVDPLAVYFNAEVDLDLWKIPPSGEIIIWFSILADFSAIQEKCLFYGLSVSVNDGGIFHTALQGLNTIGKHWETIKQPAAAQTSLQELESEVARLQQANTVATSSRGAAARLQAEAANACKQGDCQLTALWVSAVA